MSNLDNTKLFEQMGYVPPPLRIRNLSTLTQDLTTYTPALSSFIPWPPEKDIDHVWQCEYCRRHNVSVFENCIGCGSSFRVYKIKHIDIGKMSEKEAEKVIKSGRKF